jgi:predicted transcriptional regulator
VADVIDRAVPTCTPDEHLGDVVQRLGNDWDICVVVNDKTIVQGRLRRDRVAADDQRAVGEIMEPGPATVRADADLTETSERMNQRQVRTLIVSTPEGMLLGVLRTGTTAALTSSS